MVNYKKDIIKLLRSFLESARVFPYLRYLIIIFPFFALIIDDGLINSIWSLIFILPFIFVMTAGFMYNTIADAEKDPLEKNPITRNEITKVKVLYGLVLCILFSIILFYLVYNELLSLILFLFYIFLWLFYSGFKVRFKESIFAPIIATIVLWIGPSTILVQEFHYWNSNAIYLLLGLFFIYIGHEIKHSIIEHDMDFSFHCRTYSVILGKKNASITEYLSLFIGFIILLLGFYNNLKIYSTVYIAIFGLIVLISMISTISYGLINNFNLKRDNILITMPYIATKVFIISYGCLVLKIQSLLVIFIIWIYLIDKYP